MASRALPALVATEIANGWPSDAGAPKPREVAAIVGKMDLNHLNLRVQDAAVCRAFYETHFGFWLAWEADGGYFLRNDGGFLLALVPVEAHQPLPDGFHIGFSLAEPEAVVRLNDELTGAGIRVADVEDFRPDEDYVTFRCWDPDGTEIEIYWDNS
jgi:catechol 2,3-dioxygenase-like lactoylglutathione lyase family enzyme